MSTLLQTANELLHDLSGRLESVKKLAEMLAEAEKNEQQFVCLSILATNILSDSNETIASLKNYMDSVVKHIAPNELISKEQQLDATAQAARGILSKRFLEIAYLSFKACSNQEQKDAIATISQNFISSYLSDTPKPARKLQAMIADFEVSLAKVYQPVFSQDRAEISFSSTLNRNTSSSSLLGKAVLEEANEVARELRRGNLQERDRFKVTIFYHEGHWVAKNNRSLAAFASQAIEPRIVILMPDAPSLGYYRLRECNTGLQVRNPQPLGRLYLESKDNGKRAIETQVDIPAEWQTNLLCPEGKREAILPDSPNGASSSLGFFASEHKTLTESDTSANKPRNAR